MLASFSSEKADTEKSISAFIAAATVIHRGSFHSSMVSSPNLFSNLLFVTKVKK
ncbi:MAG: hypothetical protein AAF063_09140 [Cyanobacteria bacterium J06643_5]